MWLSGLGKGRCFNLGNLELHLADAIPGEMSMVSYYYLLFRSFFFIGPREAGHQESYPIPGCHRSF